MVKKKMLLLRKVHGRLYEIHNKYRIKRIKSKSEKKIKKIKNLYNGERCFIIGNGPSLSVKDLLQLKNEITFACNGIFYMFDKTDWRPDYYFVQDYQVILSLTDYINKVRAKKDRFVGWAVNNEFNLLHNFTFIPLFSEDFYPNDPKFSEDLSQCVADGYTTTYSLIQLAVYMGFKKIYLIGIDHNYSTETMSDGTIVQQSVNDHFDSKDRIYGAPALYKTTVAYKKAKCYCDKNGIEIFNATRGGKLEVFERKRLEDIL